MYLILIRISKKQMMNGGCGGFVHIQTDLFIGDKSFSNDTCSNLSEHF